MNDLKFFDQQHELLTIVPGIPKKFNSHKIAGTRGFHIKVHSNGYMLFQHIPGALWNIWISHYLFDIPTTIFCEGHIEGVEFHNILEGNALYKNGEDDWQHFKEGDHNILFSPQVNSIAKFNGTTLVSFDIHLSIPSFKQLVANQPAFREWVTYFNSGINHRLYPGAASRNIPLQAMIMEIVDKCKQSSFDSNGNQALLGQFLDSVLHNKSYNCDYKFTYEEIRRLIKAKETLSAEPGKKIRISELYRQTAMGHKKFTEGFKLVFGVVPSVYVLTEKIRVCKSLMLQQKDLTNEDYASIMNFNSGSHFARTFKNIEGCTPKEYRSKYGLVKDKGRK